MRSYFNGDGPAQGWTLEAEDEKARRIAGELHLGARAPELLKNETNLTRQAELEKAQNHLNKVTRGRDLKKLKASGQPMPSGSNLTKQAEEASLIAVADQADWAEQRTAKLDAPKAKPKEAAKPKESAPETSKPTESLPPLANHYPPGDFAFDRQFRSEYDTAAGAWADKQVGRQFNIDYINEKHRFESQKHGYHAIASVPVASGYRALGRYQFLPAALQDMGFLDKDAHGRLFWTGRHGVNSAADFLNNSKAQELAIREYIQIQSAQLRHNGAMKSVGRTLQDEDGLFTLTRTGLLGAAHFYGAGGMNSVLRDLAEHDYNIDRLLESISNKDKRARVKHAFTRARDLMKMPTTLPEEID